MCSFVDQSKAVCAIYAMNWVQQPRIRFSKQVSSLHTGFDYGPFMAEVFVDTVGGTYDFNIYPATFTNANANVSTHINS